MWFKNLSIIFSQSFDNSKSMSSLPGSFLSTPHRRPLLRVHLTLVAFSVYLGFFVVLQSYQ